MGTSKVCYKQVACGVQGQNGSLKMLSKTRDPTLPHKTKNMTGVPRGKGLSLAHSVPRCSLGKKSTVILARRQRFMHLSQHILANSTSPLQLLIISHQNKEVWTGSIIWEHRNLKSKNIQWTQVILLNVLSQMIQHMPTSQSLSVSSHSAFHCSNEMLRILICVNICLSVLVLVLMALWIKTWSLFVLFQTAFFYLK